MARNKTVYGVGILDKGEFKSSLGKGKHTKVYNVWNSMLKRCYSRAEHIINPTYTNCKVVKEWYSFQTFAKWFFDNYKENYQLDKDIIIPGNKIYGPDTCAFVPKVINLLVIKPVKPGKYPIGVYKDKNYFNAKLRKRNKQVYIGTYPSIKEAAIAYKEAKIKHIKEMAEEFKEVMSSKVYNALINYSTTTI